MSSSIVRAGAAIASALLLFTLAPPGFAQSSQRPAPASTVAQGLFQQGMLLKKARKYSEAISMFEASFEHEPVWANLFHIADCYEALGRTATAWTAFRTAEAEARSAGWKHEESLAARRARALEAVLARIKVEITIPTAGIVVKLNRSELYRGSFGVAIPVDPGLQLLEATAPGKTPWSQIVWTSAGETITVTVGKLGDEARPARPRTTREAAPAWNHVASSPGTSQPSGSAAATNFLRGLGVSGVVASGVLGGIAAGFFLHARSKGEESAVAEARAGRCSQPCVNAQNEKIAAERHGWVTFLPGLAAGLSGGALLIGAHAATHPSVKADPFRSSTSAHTIEMRTQW